MCLVTENQIVAATKVALFVFQGKIQECESEKMLSFERNPLNNLPEDVLLHILSLLSTKEIIVTSGISKRWRYLWKMVPKFEYDDRYHVKNYKTFLHFVEKSLVLYKGPSLVSLRFNLGPKCPVENIGLWMNLAVDRNISELTVKYNSSHHGHMRLTRRLLNCKTLVFLKLKNAFIDCIPPRKCINSLRTLNLKHVKYFGDASLRNLLSSCPLLQNLVVKRRKRDYVRRFDIRLKYLQRLRLYTSPLDKEADSVSSVGYVINTPNLKYLKIKDHCTCMCSFEDMPYLEEAHLDVAFTNSDKLFESLSSVKKLSLCLKKSKTWYPESIIFSRLVHLELCTCDDGERMNLLMHLLHDSPKLRVLKLNNDKEHNLADDKVCLRYWKNLPGCVPECLTKSLEIFEWRNYKATCIERDLVAYILKNGLLIKKLVISPQFEWNINCDHHIIREDLSSLFIGSSFCQLKFD